MTKLNERDTSEDMIDLGAATAETKGVGHIPQLDAQPEQFRPGSMLTAD